MFVYMRELQAGRPLLAHFQTLFFFFPRACFPFLSVFAEGFQVSTFTPNFPYPLYFLNPTKDLKRVLGT